MSNVAVSPTSLVEPSTKRMDPGKTVSQPRSTIDVHDFALITGTISEIGRVCAEAFAQEECAGIALLDLSAQPLSKVEQEKYRSKKKSSPRLHTNDLCTQSSKQEKLHRLSTMQHNYLAGAIMLSMLRTVLSSTRAVQHSHRHMVGSRC